MAIIEFCNCVLSVGMELRPLYSGVGSPAGDLEMPGEDFLETFASLLHQSSAE
jgi:hypothetical protein